MADWTAQTILDTLTANREQFRAMGVLKLGLFGSYVRGEQHPDSDMDFLVELDEKYLTFKNYMKLKHYLENTFDSEVDLVIETDIKPFLRPYILSEAVWPSSEIRG